MLGRALLRKSGAAPAGPVRQAVAVARRTTPAAPRMRGFTLTEMMIGVAISLFLLTGLLMAVTTATKSSSDTLGAVKGAQDLRGAMLMIGRDLRRAGYWASATGMVGDNTVVNPFGVVNTAVAGCILFSYDRNDNGVRDAAESFGYRLNNGVIEARTAGASDDCTGGGHTWEALTDAKVNTVSALTFTQAEKSAAITGGGQMVVREVSVDAAAALTRDASVKQSFTETIRVRNDLYRP